MRIAITGATGFLGRHLIRCGLDRGHQITAWYRDKNRIPRDLGHVDWIRGELGNPDDAKRLVESVDAVIHSGLARSGPSFLDSGGDPLDYWHRNSTGSLQLLQSAAQAGASRFIFISSGAVHDNVLPDHPLDETHPPRPKTLYGAYKASVESLVHHFGSSGKLCAATIRPPAIYGLNAPPEDSKWYDLVRRICRHEDVQATGGSKTVHAKDVAAATMLVLGQQADTVAGEVFNCCDRMISDYEVATIAKEISGSRSNLGGQAKVAKHQIDTSKIRALGMEFGGDTLLRNTIAELVSAAEKQA